MHSSYYRGPVQTRALPTGVLAALAIVLLFIFLLWCALLLLMHSASHDFADLFMGSRIPTFPNFLCTPSDNMEPYIYFEVLQPAKWPLHWHATYTHRQKISERCTVSGQADCEGVLRVLLPMVLCDTDSLPRRGPGQRPYDCAKDNHHPAESGGGRLVRVWHEQSGPQTGRQRLECHRLHKGGLLSVFTTLVIPFGAPLSRKEAPLNAAAECCSCCMACVRTKYSGTILISKINAPVQGYMNSVFNQVYGVLGDVDSVNGLLDDVQTILSVDVNVTDISAGITVPPTALSLTLHA